MGFGVWVGDVFDFAIDKLKAKHIAADFWVLASTAAWNETSIIAAFRFSKGYLDRLFGQRRVSIRLLYICLIFAAGTTELAYRIPGFDEFYGGIGKGAAVVALPILVLISGLADAASVTRSREILERALMILEHCTNVRLLGLRTKGGKSRKGKTRSCCGSK
jgi:hypothetical protein